MKYPSGLRSHVLSLIALLLMPLLTRQNLVAEESPAWVEESNRNAQILLKVLAASFPESAGSWGVDGLDEEILDLKPGYRERRKEGLNKALVQLRRRLAETQQPAVRQDLQIMIDQAEQTLESMRLSEQYELPYFNPAQTIFSGLRALLDDQTAPERRPAALLRLQKYSGRHKGFTPLTELAIAHTREKLADADLLFPFKGEVERNLGNSERLAAGIGELFKKYEIAGYEEAYAALKTQLAAYDEFVRGEILPRAREDFRLPPELYAFQLKQFGIDMPVDELQRRARVAYKEIQNQMQGLTPIIAREKGWEIGDYRQLIRRLKSDQVVGEDILPFYQKRITELEEIIRRENIVTLPQRPMIVRLASEAESAALPVPHMQPPRMIGNTGEQGEFVLPLKFPGAENGQDADINDFTYEAISWALAVHEGRPGHEMQFASMVEKGVSQARVLFAFNSVNVEGWGLYVESEMRPYFSAEGQFGALMSLMMRAVRAFVDPGLQAGTITQAEVMRVLEEEVGLSHPMALTELERYTFRAPGQATSYFCGYLRLMELRSETELLLGKKFDRRKFHDFILAQGLLPPALMRKAVLEEFVPSMKSGS